MTATDSYARLLSPGRLGTLDVPNRIVLTPMGTNLEAADGTPGERITRFYEARAAGGAGLIIVGVTGVAWPAGVSNPHNMGLSRDDFVPAFAALTRRVHAQGAKIAVQLQHAGRVSLQDVLHGRPVWVPSVTRDSAGDLFDALTPAEIARVTAPYTQPTSRLAYHAMTHEDIAQLARWFADAALRAQAAGFDGVEIHAGHGYLLSSFLSPSSNQRDDEYGGPLENRARALIEVIRAVRARVGVDFPVWCRLDGVEYRKAVGIAREDAQRTAAMAVEAGLDAVHVSAYADPRSGIAFTDAPLPHEPAAYLGLAAEIKRCIDKPVIAVGRITPERAEAALGDGACDFVAMGRALLADPELPRKLAAGGGGIRPCVYAYRCVGNVFLRAHTTCVVNPTVGREDEASITPFGPTPRVMQRVLIAGGGPAGLDTARLLAEGGHQVTLCERSDQLGGAGRAAAVFEPANRALIEYLTAEVARLPIDVHREREVTPALVSDFDPDVVVIAVGARPVRLDVPGADSECVLDLDALCEGPQVLRRRGTRIVIVGGDLIGVEVAECLSGQGCDVTIIDGADKLATQMAPPRRWRALDLMKKRGVRCLPATRVSAINPGVVLCTDADGRELTVPADAVLATAAGPDLTLIEALSGLRARVEYAGDCGGQGLFEGAFIDARRIARTVGRVGRA